MRWNNSAIGFIVPVPSIPQIRRKLRLRPPTPTHGRDNDRKRCLPVIEQLGTRIKSRLFSAKERNALKIMASIESNLAWEVYGREY
jgi:hypothetical protein